MSTAVQMTGPRPSWSRRFFQLPLGRIVLGALVLVLAAFTPEAIIHSYVAKAYRPVWPEVLSAGVALLAYRFHVRRAEKREAAEASGARAVHEVAAGLGLGFVMVGAAIAALATTGAYHFTRMNPGSFALVVPIGEMVFVGVLEELLFRGLLFRITERALGTWPALAISSVLFGLAHLPGSSATVLAIAVTGVAGVMLTAAYLVTRRLWLAIGIHIGWNYTLGTVWSIAVSGHPAQEGLLTGQLSGPEWLTGGAYGLEGSVVTLGVLLIATAVLLRRAAAKGTLVLRRDASADA
jgi:hypothetical protein